MNQIDIYFLIGSTNSCILIAKNIKHIGIIFTAGNPFVLQKSTMVDKIKPDSIAIPDINNIA